MRSPARGATTDPLMDASPRLSSKILDALSALSDAVPAQVHGLQVGLARLVLADAPPAAARRLALATAFIEGHASREELRDARTDCWTDVGSLACGCSLADSASAHAVLSCLEVAEEAHRHTALVEQVSRVSSCGATESSILHVLGVCR